MSANLGYAILSLFLISLVSLIGVVTLGIQTEKLKKILIYLVAFSAGTLMGNAFLHLLPEVVEEYGFQTRTGFALLGGILIGLITEKVIHRNHCHMPITKDHQHPFAWMNLVGDIVHNLVDGMIIGVAFISGIEI